MNTTEHVTNKGKGTTRIPNKLVDEKSPYLLQHAYNPVKWYPWGEEAFQKAKDENKPIFLSIGYSTCHWCHVMAHESFEDDEVATLLNENYVSIKVDKEERPDIDTVYMTICQVTTGSGGWPLTILMSPDKKPFYAATYIPKEAQYGMIGLCDLLTQVTLQWRNDPGDMLRTGAQLADIMKREFEASSDSADVTKDLVNLAVTQFSQSFDHDYGGFGNEPKFPSPHNLMFLLRHAKLENDEKSLFMVENTLKHMFRGGIYDHIGYGFSRYSTDAKWLVPHFEKMLYDNALLALVYTEAYQYTKEKVYFVIAEQIFEYIRREMTDAEGGFYSAQDADSEGEEGKYYTFTTDEIINVLGNSDGSFFCEFFDITKEGNFEGGVSIPNLIKSKDFNTDNERIVRLCNALYDYRRDRHKLHTDDKILTSWNALMITAYANAAKVFQTTEYLDTAKHAMDFINSKLMTEDDRLLVRYRDNDAAFQGHLDDYAFYCMACISLYEATFEVDYLKKATTTAYHMIQLFWDDKYGGFFLNANDSEQLLYRPKEVYDGAIPSGNSVAGYVLQRLANITANQDFMGFANKQLRFLAGQVKDYPAGHSFSLIAFMQKLYPTKEIVCVASRNASSRANDRSATDLENHLELSNYLSQEFEPNTVVLLKTDQNTDDLTDIAYFTQDYRTVNDKTTYYVCENHHCYAPTNELTCYK